MLPLCRCATAQRTTQTMAAPDDRINIARAPTALATTTTTLRATPASALCGNANAASSRQLHCATHCDRAERSEQTNSVRGQSELGIAFSVALRQRNVVARIACASVHYARTAHILARTE